MLDEPREKQFPQTAFGGMVRSEPLDDRVHPPLVNLRGRRGIQSEPGLYADDVGVRLVPAFRAHLPMDVDGGWRSLPDRGAGLQQIVLVMAVESTDE